MHFEGAREKRNAMGSWGGGWMVGGGGRGAGGLRGVCVGVWTAWRVERAIVLHTLESAQPV